MIKKFILNLIDFLGYEIYPKLSEKQKEENETPNLLKSNKWLINYNFKTIIDIGANEGQSARRMRKLFPDAQIISFEPLLHEYNKLCESFQGDKNFFSYNVALGEKETTTKMWLNEFSPASSLLRMKEHLYHFNYARSQSPIDIKIVALDQVLDISKLELPYLVKIDVQGFEENVIKGGSKVISNAAVVITEVSFSQLYENHLLFDGIYSLIKNLGFMYVGNYDQMHSPINNEVLQADAIFVKASGKQ